MRGVFWGRGSGDRGAWRWARSAPAAPLGRRAGTPSPSAAGRPRSKPWPTPAVGTLLLVQQTSPLRRGLLRLRANGARDVTFGRNGFLEPTFARIWDVAVTPGGKLVLAGYRESADRSGTEMIVARLDRDGGLDTSFAETGVREVDFGTRYTSGLGVALQDDGKVVVTGTGRDYVEQRGPYNGSPIVARLNGDGSMDDEFSNGDGLLVLPGASSATAASVLDNGAILVSLSQEGEFSLLKIGPIGWVNGGFGGQGYVGYGSFANDDGFFEAGEGIVARPDGRFFVAGRFQRRNSEGNFLALKAFQSNGQVDLSFGSRGMATMGFSGSRAPIAFAARPGGGFLLSGGYQLFSVRPGGAVDRRFGDRGKFTPYFGGFDSISRVTALLVRGKQRALLAGVFRPNMNRGQKVGLQRIRLPRPVR